VSKIFNISMPKCIELNSKSKPKLILVLGLGVTQEPGPIYSFFGGMSDQKYLSKLGMGLGKAQSPKPNFF